jgi:hypothetical protein
MAGVYWDLPLMPALKIGYCIPFAYTVNQLVSKLERLAKINAQFPAPVEPNVLDVSKTSWSEPVT